MKYLFAFIFTLPSLLVILFFAIVAMPAKSDEFDYSRFYEAKMAIRERLDEIANKYNKKKPDAMSQHVETLASLMQVQVAYPEIDFKVTHEAVNDVSLITASVKYEDPKSSIAWRFDSLFRPEGTYLFETDFSDLNSLPEFEPETSAYLWRRYD